MEWNKKKKQFLWNDELNPNRHVAVSQRTSESLINAETTSEKLFFQLNQEIRSFKSRENRTSDLLINSVDCIHLC